MIEEEVVEKTNKVFEDFFEIEPERLVPEADIFTDFGLDSLDIVDVIVALQKSFGVNIRDEENVRNIRTLDDIYKFIINVKKEQESKR